MTTGEFELDGISFSISLKIRVYFSFWIFI